MVRVAYLIAAALLCSAAAGTALAANGARRSVAQLEDLRQVPWTGGTVHLSTLGTVALYRVSPGYAGGPAGPTPDLTVVAPNGRQMNLLPPGGSTSGKAVGKDANEAAGTVVKLGSISAREVGRMRVGQAGDYQVVLEKPLPVGDALALGPPVDRYVGSTLMWVKAAIVLEVLGLLALLVTIARHWLADSGVRPAAALHGALHRARRRLVHAPRRSLADVVDTFGAPPPAVLARRQAHARRSLQPEPSTIDLRPAPAFRPATASGAGSGPRPAGRRFPAPPAVAPGGAARPAAARSGVRTAVARSGPSPAVTPPVAPGLSDADVVWLHDAWLPAPAGRTGVARPGASRVVRVARPRSSA